jgi:hypothetical protein
MNKREKMQERKNLFLRSGLLCLGRKRERDRECVGEQMLGVQTLNFSCDRQKEKLSSQSTIVCQVKVKIYQGKYKITSL